MSGKTGETCRVSGIYQAMNCHREQRSIPKNHTFPPCSQCPSAVVWRLIQAADTNPRR